MKIIPAEYKLADEIKKSPKGFSTTLERVGKSVKGPKMIKTDVASEEQEKVEKPTDEVNKSKKKSLDELLEGGMM